MSVWISVIFMSFWIFLRLFNVYFIRKQKARAPSELLHTVACLLAQSFIFSWLFHKFRDPKHCPGGELVLGGTDPNYYTGNFNYLETREIGKWEVTMKGWDLCSMKHNGAINNGKFLCHISSLILSVCLSEQRWCFVLKAAPLLSIRAPLTSQAPPPPCQCWWKPLERNRMKLEYVSNTG